MRDDVMMGGCIGLVRGEYIVLFLLASGRAGLLSLLFAGCDGVLTVRDERGYWCPVHCSWFGKGIYGGCRGSILAWDCRNCR